MSKTINTGLIGFGLAGSVFHAPIINGIPELNLMSISSSRIEQIKSIYPDIKTCSSPEQIIFDSNIDLVVIASPTDTHYDLVKKSLIANKHVVIDKPFVIKSSEAIELTQLAHDKNKLLCVYQNRRWDNDFLTIKKLLNEDKLGGLYHFESHFDRFRPEVQMEKWREQDKKGSGLLYDLGAHLIDQAIVLFGMPNWVQADITKQRPNAVVDDYFHIIFGYGRLRVILHSSSVVKADVPRFILHGDKGSFIKFGLDPQENALRSGKVPKNNLEWGVEDESLSGTLTVGNSKEMMTSQAGQYTGFYHHVYKSIKSDESFPITHEQAIQVIQLIEISKQSSTEARRIHI
ncbi:MAG: scyllo-inositol 2-dehydrogenase (NADP+) [Francisellaceae bacterium]